MKRVLIIGASSPLGRLLCAEFQRQGWYVIWPDPNDRNLIPRSVLFLLIKGDPVCLPVDDVMLLSADTPP